ncbi:MAG: deoxyribose-phosphate aldolase [Lysobacteraceae bacterium]|nr:MAG: deoxyribose-phosphate aldolase [Xanthomonadaceae bacterium]
MPDSPANAASPPEPRGSASRVLSLLDLTSLGDDDTPEAIHALCASARLPERFPAAICVYPEHVTTAREAMRGASVKIATVVNFPDGGDDPLRIARETRRAIAAGADEIDMVLPYRSLLAGDVLVAKTCVEACRQACGDTIALKLILETGELRDAQIIRAACRIGLDAGVDFLKTSTGKVAVNATPEAAAVMLDCIAASGGACGFKAAGGIRTIADALRYMTLAEDRLGAAWVAPERFRIGASALFAEVSAMLEATP